MNKQTLLILGVVAIAAVVLLKRQTPVTYYPPVTGNAQRDSQVSQILAYAAAAGATATAIANLISQINGSNDSQVSSLLTTSKADPGFLVDYFG